MKRPLLLKLALHLPLRCQHWLREKLEAYENWSQYLVCEDRDELLRMIENCEHPDFQEFDRRLNEARKRWGKHDSSMVTMAVGRRFLAFKLKHQQKVSPPSVSDQTGDM